MYLDPNLNYGWGWRRKTVLSPPVEYLTDCSKAVLLLWIFYVFSVLSLLCLCERLFICALWSPAGKGLTSWPSYVVSNCEFVTFPLVSLVRCGTWLYRFLIFAHLLTLVYELKKIVGSNSLSAQFIKIISHYKKICYNINVLQQTACLLVNQIMVGNFAFLFNCTLVGWTLDSMTVPT